MALPRLLLRRAPLPLLCHPSRALSVSSPSPGPFPSASSFFPQLRDLAEPQGHSARHPRPTVVATADEAVACITSGSQVFLHSAAATPTPLVEAMTRRGLEQRLTDVTVLHMHVDGPAPYQQPEAAGIFRSLNYFIGANARESVNAGRGDYVPIFLSEIPSLFRKGVQKIDVALISVSPADRHGYHSLGPSVDITRAALQVAEKVVGMVNPRMPRTFGDASVHESHIDVVYEHEMPLHSHASAKKAEGDEGGVEDAIGRLIATNLVRDGSTLQMGIGSIPNAVLHHLKGHRDLGVHSEMFSDGVVDLVLSGAITGAKKTIHTGRITAGFAVGSPALFDFMNDNPGVVMRDIAFVNNVANIARQYRMTAINSAIEVDITGQVSSREKM
jgi:acyl-CoA hydrolase